MKRKTIKYGLLGFLGVAMLYQFVPIDDYCGGLLTVLNFILFGGFLLAAFLIVTIIDFIRFRKKKGRFDFIPLFKVLFFGLAWIYITQKESDKFWTDEILSGRTLIDGPKMGALKLYENKSFGATYFHADYSCTFQGSYEFTNDTLTLDRKDLSILTDSLFTTEYVFIQKDSTFYPIDENFGEIKIR